MHNRDAWNHYLETGIEHGAAPVAQQTCLLRREAGCNIALHTWCGRGSGAVAAHTENLSEATCEQCLTVAREHAPTKIRPVEISVSTNQNPGHLAQALGDYLSRSLRFFAANADRVEPPMWWQSSSRHGGTDVRRAVAALIDEYARGRPAFAVARRCAVLAGLETSRKSPAEQLRLAASILEACIAYEDARGGGRTPLAVAQKAASDAFEQHGGHPVLPFMLGEALGAYERARSRI